MKFDKENNIPPKYEKIRSFNKNEISQLNKINAQKVIKRKNDQ